MLASIDWYNPWLMGVGLNTILLAIALLAPKKLLTPAGYVHACLLGVLVWGTLGWQGYAVVMFYFLMGSAVTRLGMKQKEAEGIAEKRSGARGPENVWGSALIPALCALVSLFVSSPLREFLILAYVAGFCTKLSDTTASEIGKAYGQRTFLITTLQPVARGTEGAVSLEGTVAGIIASGAIALFAWAIGIIDLLGMLWCILAAFVATTLESFIGATLQPKFDLLTNEVVNIINTIIAAAVVVLLAWGWQNFAI
ncbi:MAG: TIGR00297 family protein [Oscillatoria sp. PMC 1051.18]|nr:TIGR00297 family protein [Oscillatoria sp. PMC 1050.18]MEC5030735.1 TIGR00297 family protein [Oscillatoria sp. PMC 1051.18]